MSNEGDEFIFNFLEGDTMRIYWLIYLILSMYCPGMSVDDRKGAVSRCGPTRCVSGSAYTVNVSGRQNAQVKVVFLDSAYTLIDLNCCSCKLWVKRMMRQI